MKKEVDSSISELKNFLTRFEEINKAQTVKKEGIFLIELGILHSTNIPKYFFKSILEKRGLQCIGFESRNLSVRDKFSFKIRATILSGNPSVDPISLYKELGIKKFIYPKIKIVNRLQSWLKFRKIYKKISEDNIISFKYDSILIGDIIHDHFLRYSLEEKVRIKSKRFKKFFIQSLYMYEYWKTYIKANNVRYISVLHTQFLSALPLRICIANGGFGLLISSDRVFKLHQHLDQSDREYTNYKKLFDSLYENFERQRAISVAKKRLIALSEGGTKVDARHFSISGFKSNTDLEQVIVANKKLNIVIFCHCFSDAPNIILDNFFINFWDWLEFLAMHANKTDYNWYVKPHPGFTKTDWIHYENFLKKYPTIKQIPSDYGLTRLVIEGINFGFTMYGTIGMDLAYLGIPVINASRGHPHIDYKFTITPESRENLSKIIMDLPNIDFIPKIGEIEEYYFMHNVRNTNNWFYHDYHDMLNFVEIYGDQWNSLKIYEYINIQHNEIDILDKLRTIEEFLDSDSYRLRYSYKKGKKIDLFKDF